MHRETYTCKKRSAETPKIFLSAAFKKKLPQKFRNEFTKILQKNNNNDLKPKIKFIQIIHGQVLIHLSAREQLLEVCITVEHIQ